MAKPEETQPTHSSTSDTGGVAARKGFKYQDHAAAQFVLQMISNPNLLQVECETADDIVLVWLNSDSQNWEYVQVKTTENDKKWSQTEITKRDSGAGAKRPTSLIEKSLLCDVNGDNAKFRIVSQRDVYAALYCLKTPLDQRGDSSPARELGKKISKKLKTVSANGKDLEYWASNALWQVTGDVGGLKAKNSQALLSLAEKHGANPTHSHIIKIYDDLLRIIDNAATASRTTDIDKKIINRDFIISWWEGHLSETEAASKHTSKPYRTVQSPFLTELHEITETDILRAFTGYDARYDLEKWRSEQLAEYLAGWLPEMTLRASELVEVDSMNLREKLKSAYKVIKANRDIELDRLIAELLLHAVLRQRGSSEPIACKLFYRSGDSTKTFGNAHIVHDDKDRLWLGRANLATFDTYDDVVTTIIDEISHILDPDFLKKEREIILTLREPQHLLPTSLESVLHGNAPIDDLIEVLCIPVLLAYDSNVLGEGFCDDYREKLTEEICLRYQSLKILLPAEVQKIQVHIFLIPIESVALLTKQFSAEIGAV